MSYIPEIGARGRSRTVFSALARPYSAVEPHPLENGVPSRTLTSNLEFRTLLLCALSYGDRKPSIERTDLPVWLTGSVPVATSPEKGSFLLLVKPTKELLEARIGLNLLDRVELVAQFVMRPRFVDEILAGMAGRGDVAPAFAARHNMMSSRGHLPVAECADFVHTVGPKFLLKDIHSCRRLKVFEPLAGLFHQLTPAFVN